MFGSRVSGRRRRGEGLSPFQKLEARGRRLEASIFFLVALIAFAPPLFYSILQVRQLRARAAVHAGHVAAILEIYGHMPKANLEGLKRHLRAELERDDLASLGILDAAGVGALDVGTPPAWARLDSVDLLLPPGPLPYSKVRVAMHDEPLQRDIARIVGVHLLVGLVLGLGIYRIPVRAFARAIEELRSAQAQLVHADRLSALGSVYASLSHEINNPLGILSARAKLALAAAREKGLDDETVRDLEVIDRQGTRLAEIVRGLLAFARKAESSMRPVDLNAVVREVVGLVKQPFSKQGVRLESDLDPTLPVLQASPDQLQQVLLNLVTNARDAMPSGGTIRLRTARANGHLIAEVRDTGSGLTAEVQEHLFEPFYTTKDVGKGTGLGLSVSYGIAKAHGGQLEGANAPGGGALFRLSLPAGGGAP
jgi:signal transduction histidine kinase